MTSANKIESFLKESFYTKNKERRERDMDIVSYLLSKKFTKKTVDGLGAIKGAPCTVKSIVDITGGKRITLEWEGNSGEKQTQSFDIMNGVDGRSISSVEVNAEGHLIIHYSDGTSDDAGVVEVDVPVKSVNGKIGDVTLTASDVGALPDDTSIPSKTSLIISEFFKEAEIPIFSSSFLITSSIVLYFLSLISFTPTK